MEENIKFLSNKGVFYVLRDSKLIEKVRIGKYIGWSISNDFLTVLENLNREGYPPAIVFKIFSFEISETSSETKSKIDPTMNLAQDFLAKWESEWPEIVPHIKGFIDYHGKIINSYGEYEDEPFCDNCRCAITELIRSAQIILKDKESPENWLNSTWLEIPNSEAIYSLLCQESIEKGGKIEYYQRYHQSASVILESLSTLLEINKIINIISSKNGKEEMRVLYNAGSLFLKGDYKGALDEINAILEKRIRVAFHLAFSLHFGDDYLKSLPDYIQPKILESEKRGLPVLKREIDKNLFYHFSRSEYSHIINNEKNWKDFFEIMFAPRSKEEVAKALELTFSLDDRAQHRDRQDYFRKVKDQVREAISSSSWLLSSLANVIQLSINPLGFIDEIKDDHHVIRVSFASEKQSQGSHSWKILKIRGKEIANRLMKTSTPINFSEDIAVSTVFNGSLAEIFIIISMLKKNNLIEIENVLESNMHVRIQPLEKLTNI